MRVAALIRHNLALMLHEPGPLLSRVAMPVVLMTVLRPLYMAALPTGGGTSQTVTGVLVMFSLLGMSVTGASILAERVWHTADRLRASPAHPAEVLIGKAVPVLVLLFAQQTALIAYGVVVLGLRVADPGLLILAVSAWALALLGIGAAIATAVRSHSGLSAITDIGGLICTCLGGALVPLATMPAWARDLAPASPGYWAMRALGGALAGDATRTLRSILVLTAIALTASTVAGALLRRGWGRARPV
jgi:ABC-2 type transport system permease protein